MRVQEPKGAHERPGAPRSGQKRSRTPRGAHESLGEPRRARERAGHYVLVFRGLAEPWNRPPIVMIFGI